MELIKELEEKYEKMRKDLGLKSTLDQVDNYFYIRDAVIKNRGVPYALPRMVGVKAIEMFNSWIGFLHSLIIPNPNSMIEITQAQIFDEEEKKDINNLIVRLMGVTSRNPIRNLVRDEKKDAEYIDELVSVWKEVIPKLVEIEEKISDNWKEKESV